MYVDREVVSRDDDDAQRSRNKATAASEALAAAQELAAFLQAESAQLKQQLKDMQLAAEAAVQRGGASAEDQERAELALARLTAKLQDMEEGRKMDVARLEEELLTYRLKGLQECVDTSAVAMPTEAMRGIAAKATMDAAVVFIFASQ